MAVVNTANNQVVGRWDEEGSLKGIRSIVKISDGDLSDYTVSTDKGLRFIQITCKKVKGKNKFSFLENPTTSNKVFTTPSTAIVDYPEDVLVVVTEEEEVIQYDFKADSTIASLSFAAVNALPFSEGLLLLVTKEGLISTFDVKKNQVKSTGLQVSGLAASSTE